MSVSLVLAWSGCNHRSSAPSAAPSIQPAQWAPVGHAPVDLKSFGARGDGISDDTAAFQAAVNAAAGGTLLVPAGDYSVGTVHLTSGSTHIVGAGPSSRLVARMPDSAVMVIGDCDHAWIEKLQIVAAAGDRTGVGVSATGSRFLSVVGCTLFGFGRAGILTRGGSDIALKGNVIVGNGDAATQDSNGIYCASGSGANSNVRVEGNDVSRTGQGIASGPLQKLTVVGNTIHDITGALAQHGMYIASNSAAIAENHVRTVKLCGIKVMSAATDQSSVLVWKNQIDGGWDGSNGLGGGAGVEVDGPGDKVHTLRDAAIAGNTIKSMRGYGVSVGNSTLGVSLLDNDISNVASSGIICQQSAQAITILRNSLRNVAVGQSGNGVQFSTGSFTGLVIQDNTFDGVPAGRWNISLAHASHVLATGNRMVGAAGAGALAVEDSSDLVLLDNKSDNTAVRLPTTAVTSHSGNSWE